MTGAFIKICTFSEISSEQIKVVNVNGREIVLIKANELIYALDNICTHDGGELGDGTIIDGQIQCPRHGARFDLKTGAATQMPAAVGITAYPVKVEDGKVFLAVPDYGRRK